MADPARSAGSLKTRPWTVAIEGAVKKPGNYDLDMLLKLSAMGERIYSVRYVEGGSMVVPWVGCSLAEMVARVEPTGNAEFVEFITLADKAQMPGCARRCRLALQGVLGKPSAEAQTGELPTLSSAEVEIASCPTTWVVGG